MAITKTEKRQPAPIINPSQTPTPGVHQSPRKAPAAKVNTQSLPIAPMSRPTPQQAAKQDGATIVAMALAGQLGTAPQYLARMLIDERKFCYVSELQMTALNYFDYRAQVDGIRFWDYFVEGERVGSQGVDGRGSRRVLEALSSAAGSPSLEPAQKPNLVARNLWKRNWKKDAQKNGAYVDE